ncbi:MAG TPA: cation:proton antiporter, partial [Vicinamibacterales bacterium]
MKLWQILVIVGFGVAYGLIAPGRFTYALGHATLYVFLPALLFEAAWNLNYKAILRHWQAIATLAGPGVLITALIVAGALAVVRVPFGPALLTGAILSATDPIAVVAIFRRLKVPKTLATIVECESLFNDAVAVAIYRGVLVALALGATSGGTISLVVLQTLGEAAGAVVLGVVLA